MVDYDYVDLGTDEKYVPHTQDIVQSMEDNYDVPVYVVLNDRTYDITGISSDGTEVWIHVAEPE